MTALLTSTPIILPDRVQRWVINSISPGATISEANQLKGSTSSLVYSISLIVNHQKKEVVLRLFNNAKWLRDEPDLAQHEAENLRLAFQNNLLAPKLIAFDETGKSCGMPAVLMTKIRGAVNLKPQNMNKWLNGLAKSLAQIHLIQAANHPWKYFTYVNIPRLRVPSWSSFPELWKHAIEIVQKPSPKFKECFIHRDYHPANVLWDNGKVSGVIDWTNACRGPAGVDIGHCRINLAMLFDVSIANQFLLDYQKYAGAESDYNLYWDLISLVDMLAEDLQIYAGWEAFGVTGLTKEIIVQRVDEYLKSILDRVL